MTEKSRSPSPHSDGSSSTSSRKRTKNSSHKKERSKSGSSSRDSSRSSEDKENKGKDSIKRDSSDKEKNDSGTDRASPISDKTDAKVVSASAGEKEKRNEDMFSDMFGDNFAADRLGDIHTRGTDNPNLTDNWDDAEGYYRVRIGEVLDSR